MRTLSKFARPAALTAMAAALALSACGEAPETGDDDAMAEGDAMMAGEGDDALTGEEISEAVPGVDGADPESGMAATADLDDEEDLEVADPDEIDELREDEAEG